MDEDAPGIDAWKAQTSAFDRVRSVTETVSEPRPASYIANEAYVAENTARDHLERLAEMNVLLKTERDGTTFYSPDPLHTRMQLLRDLLDSHDRDELIQLKADLQTEIETWREEYAVDSPDELRGCAAETDESEETRAVLQTAGDWELVRYRLEAVEDAIEHYATYTRYSRAFA
ncbi:hypothetical protein HALLA_19425 [Halostagnicola larsenii XH-48]|uniref:Transcriptional regulator n=1 Tax=Halostagnicola larsenii XH-48 TaxID=797299 RepID=W0JPI5_9EURY|nr:hypothetical protein [Halostagnicola larsenii]AHG00636.1 hypothetical protein HALLA_19425 [Halostagnicola larsenii XH-48]